METHLLGREDIWPPRGHNASVYSESNYEVSYPTWCRILSAIDHVKEKQAGNLNQRLARLPDKKLMPRDATTICEDERTRMPMLAPMLHSTLAYSPIILP